MKTSAAELLDQVMEHIYINQYTDLRGCYVHSKIVHIDCVNPEIEGCVFYNCVIKNINSLNNAILVDCIDISSVHEKFSIRDILIKFKNGVSGMEGLDFSGEDFSDIHLKDCTFTASNLSYVNFTEAVLENVHFDEVVLDGASFHKAKINQSEFLASKTTSLDFSDTQICSSCFSQSKLNKNVFSGSKMDNVYFNHCELNECILRGSDLSFSRISYCVLNLVDLSNADLSYTNIEAVDIKESCMKGSNLTGAAVQTTTLTSVDLSDANLCGIYSPGIEMYNTNVAGAKYDERSDIPARYKKNMVFKPPVNYGVVDLTLEDDLD